MSRQLSPGEVMPDGGVLCAVAAIPEFGEKPRMAPGAWLGALATWRGGERLPEVVWLEA